MSENCSKVVRYQVFIFDVLSLLSLIIFIYCLIVTAIFLLASVILYFVQKTKNDNDDIKSMAENLSPKIDQEQSKNLISVNRNRGNNVKQQNEFGLFERADN